MASPVPKVMIIAAPPQLCDQNLGAWQPTYPQTLIINMVKCGLDYMTVKWMYYVVDLKINFEEYSSVVAYQIGVRYKMVVIRFSPVP